MKTRLVVAISSMLIAAFVAAPAYSNGWSPSRIIEIGIEADWHHVGDGIGFTSFVIPDAEGVYWETEFRLKSWQIRRSKSAHLAFYLMDSGSQYDTVAINGFPIALPGTEQLDKHHANLISKTVISIPIGLLHKGKNHIRFEATALHNPAPGNTHDDYEFGDVVLILSR